MLYGEVNDGSFYSQLIMDDVDITPIKEALIFGEAYCDLDTLDVNNMANSTTSDLVEEAS